MSAVQRFGAWRTGLLVGAAVGGLVLAGGTSPTGASVGRAAATCQARFTPVKTPHPSGIQSTLLGVERVPGTRQAWAVGNEQVSGSSARTIGVALHFVAGAWKVVPTPNPAGVSTSLTDLTVVSPTNVWAIGDRVPSPPGGGAVIEHWNGSRWSVAALPTDPHTSYILLTAISAVNATNIWAVGTSSRGPIALHYTGTGWAASWPTPFGDLFTFTDVARVPGTARIWAVGNGSGSCCFGGFAFQFANGAWRDVSMDGFVEGSGGPNALTIPAQRDVWALGDNGGATAWHFDGSVWKEYPVPVGFLSAAASRTPTDVWGAGGRTFAHWNGTRWTAVRGPASLSDAFIPALTIGPGGDGWAVANHNDTSQGQLIRLCGM